MTCGYHPKNRRNAKKAPFLRGFCVEKERKVADLSQTAANVNLVSGPTGSGTAGGTITAGMPVYKDTTDSNHLKAADADAAASAVLAGVALHGAADGQPLTYAKPGATIDWGATLTKATLYVVSTTAGGVAPAADLGSGDYITGLCIGNGTAEAPILAFGNNDAAVTGVAV
jgi:hypothetical protein